MKQFTCHYHYLGLWSWQLGFHLFCPGPNIEIHVPFGFIKIGWEDWAYYLNKKHVESIRTIGYVDGKWQIRSYKNSEAY